MKLSVNLSDLVDNKSNNFNLLRFGAAAAVILSHSFILTNTLPNAWPRIIGFFAVNCFFLISGFLVCKSLLTRASMKKFVLARCLRIYPALFIAVIFCALIIGPIHTSLSLSDYLSSWQTFKFILVNATLLGGSVEGQLPGVFNQKIVNAPLWTLFFEVYMYAILVTIWWVFSNGSKSNTKWFSIVILVLTLILFVMFISDIAYKFIGSHFVSSMVRFGALFGIGAVLYLFRSKVVLSLPVLALILILVAISSLNRLAFNGVCYFFLGYILLCVAYMPKGILMKFNNLGDYSYGLYIFSYPIQQSIIAWVPNVDALGLLFSSFLVSLTLSIASWHLLESRALNFKV
ncbi:MAG: acyltransferase [Acidiferrobacterales bacterium]|nr:acyltransferase [Acidiferrobacterales bacterium]